MSCRTKKRKEDEERKANDGEQDNFFTDEMKEEMETMWEIPQIFHFLHLTKESLNIPQLSLHEMERMLLIPRASKQLANIMTCLLSSPTTKAKLRKVPPMPYEFWTNILAYKMMSWFKVYHAKHEDATKVLEIIGVEPEFWNIFPETSMLDGRDFEELSFKQRVWLLKTVCDTIMHTRKIVQEDMMKLWNDQFETVLGIDRNGAKYIYFPQFLPNDFRIYRHSLDNKILSTVKPVIQDREMERNKFIRYRKRKLQIRNNSDRRLNRSENRNDDKDLNNDSATGSFISEDTNLSSTSTYSNNNINLDNISRKRRRSLSKMSEESSLSNARSSGYDTNTSSDNKSVDDESSQMFKGFTNTQNDNCNIVIINEMLDDLKTEIDEEKRMSERENSSDGESPLQENFVELYKNTAVSHSETQVVEKDENEKPTDNLSNSSKTDDEKLNEIINAESSKLPEDVYSKSISASDNVSDTSILTSKSDDEKLNETKTNNNNVSVSESSLNRKIFNKFCASSSSNMSLSEEMSKNYLSVSEIQSMIKTKSNKPIREKNLTSGMKLRSRNIIKQYDKENKTEATKDEIEERLEDDRTNETDEENFSASETRLQTNIEYDLDDYTNNTNYNLRRSNDPKTNECKQRFNKMLSDLNVSDFYLVADNVEELRDLVANFSTSDSESNNSNNAELIPLCEVKLVKRLTELLKSVEPIETMIKDAMRKAKTKLQREWTNFKEGSVEDQDSSGESGLSSNWWVLGSQGKDPLSTPGDATLQTLSQFALSSIGTQNTQNTQKESRQVESECESAVKNPEQSRCESREASNERQNGSDEKQSDVDAPSGRNQEVVEEREKQEHGENESASNDEDTEQETQHSRRVLRARGVSSYTEQLYSDDESDENELEEWTDVEAVYAAPGTQANTSAPHVDPKDRNTGNWSEEEDSDQDWILPSSRKRKNKRSSTNRRLKSFEHKVQNIKENASQSNVMSEASHPANAKIVKDKLKGKLQDNKIREPERAVDLRISGGNTATPTMSNINPKRTVPSMDTICKIESVKSVHSELDIKDEGPIYESTPMNHFDQNNYRPANPQQNYYYMMPQNPGIVSQGAIVQGVIPQAPPGYYAQPYMMQSQQQPVYQQQNPQMIMTQSYGNNANYVSYVATAAQSQASGPMTNQLNPQNPIYSAPRPQNRYSQNSKSAIPRQNPQYFNNTRNNTPVRGSSQRPTNSKIVKGDVPPQPPSRSRRKTSQTSSTENNGQKVTSVIMLSDSDDEIEMIVMEKTSTTEKTTPTNRARSLESQKVANQSKQKPTITSDITVPSTRGILSPQIIQRMSQGGISITPVKNNPPPTSNTNTQLVVVVNETGSHYALALPNGSKLILTPEQVAQIRASNGGKLIL